MSTINYATVDIDESKDPADYHYTERRAEILELVLRAGGPRRVSYARLAKRYGKAKSTISDDMDAIAESLAESLGDNFSMEVESAFHRIYDALMDEGEWDRAWRVVEGYAKLLERIGAIETEPTKFDVRHGEMPTESGSYELVTDDNQPTDDEVVVTAADLQPDLPMEGRPGGEDHADDD